MLAGCGNSLHETRGTLARDIGGPPAYLLPIALPAPKPNESLYVVAAQRGQIIKKQNAVITCAIAERRDTRAAFLAGKVAGEGKPCLTGK